MTKINFEKILKLNSSESFKPKLLFIGEDFVWYGPKMVVFNDPQLRNHLGAYLIEVLKNREKARACFDMEVDKNYISEFGSGIAYLLDTETAKLIGEVFEERYILEELNEKKKMVYERTYHIPLDEGGEQIIKRFIPIRVSKSIIKKKVEKKIYSGYGIRKGTDPYVSILDKDLVDYACFRRRIEDCSFNSLDSSEQGIWLLSEKPSYLSPVIANIIPSCEWGNHSEFEGDLEDLLS